MGFLIWQEMFGSGAQIGTTTITTKALLDRLQIIQKVQMKVMILIILISIKKLFVGDLFYAMTPIVQVIG